MRKEYDIRLNSPMAEIVKRESNGTSRHAAQVNASDMPKKKYKRTTPVGRVGRNIEKASRILGFSRDRLESWVKLSTDVDETKQLMKLHRKAEAIIVELNVLREDSHVLAKSGFVPPKNKVVVAFEVGDAVKISAKYIDKYRAVYSVPGLKSLVVTKILPTGELAVGSEKAGVGPILIAKSRLEKR